MIWLWEFVEILKNRGITNRETLATELLRVHLTLKAFQKKVGSIRWEKADPNQLYQVMKETTEKPLGHFAGDPQYFFELFRVGAKLDFVPALIELFKKDRSGVIVSPPHLVNYFSLSLMRGDIETVLIPEAHKHLDGLIELVQSNLGKQFVLTAEKKWLAEVLKFIFEDFFQVEVVHASLYSLLDLDQEFDLIFSIPAFGGKPDLETDRFFTRESEGIAVENLLYWLSDQGELQIVVPARFTFSGGKFAELRSWILKSFFLKSIFTLPAGSLRPFTGIKTYLLVISNQPYRKIEIGRFETEGERFFPKVEGHISKQELLEKNDWRIDLLLSDSIQELIPAKRPTAKLKDLADLFRGKSILKNDIRPGPISVLNISNIEEGEIIWEGMDTINEDERKIRRYELEVGDLVITCRGTVNKVAVVRDLPKKTIASANIIVIRFKKDVVSEYVKIFLESPVGEKLIKTFQRGTTVMNINPADLGELEIPLLEWEEQQRLAEEYYKEFRLYRDTVQKAKTRWERKKQSIYNRLLDEGGT